MASPLMSPQATGFDAVQYIPPDCCGISACTKKILYISDITEKDSLVVEYVTWAFIENNMI